MKCKTSDQSMAVGEDGNFKTKILFDGTVLWSGLRKNASRSGIFVVAYEVLRALLRREDVKVYVCSSPQSIFEVEEYILNTPELAKVSLVGFPRKTTPVNRVHKWVEEHAITPEKRRGVLRWLFYLPWRIVRKILLFCMKIYHDKTLGNELKRILHAKGTCFLSPVYYPSDEVVNSGIRRFTILYDTLPLLFPQFFNNVEGVAWNSQLCNLLTEDDCCFAISETTKRDFLRFSPGLNGDHVFVIPLAAGDKFHMCDDAGRKSRVREKYGIPQGRKYFLSLCTIEPRKNLPLAIKAFAKFAETHDDVDFVLAGGKWTAYADQWDKVMSGLGGYKDRIVPIGYVDDEDLAALYSDALSFVYISIYEGFGLPPLEAMQCGCPVLTSNTSSLPEVVGDAGLMVAPDDFDAAVAAMSQLADDSDLRRRLRTLGLQRAKMFSWDRAADIIVNKMREISQEGIS